MCWKSYLMFLLLRNYLLSNGVDALDDENEHLLDRHALGLEIRPRIKDEKQCMYSLMKSRMLKALRRSSMGFYINRMLMSMLQAATRGSFRRILSPSSEAGEMKLGQDLSHSGRLLITRDRIKQRRTADGILIINHNTDAVDQ